MMQKELRFKAYDNWSHIFNELSYEKGGMLIEHIFKYTEEDPDINPLEDEALRVAFASIKRDIDLDKEKREYIRQIRAEAGRKGGKVSGKTRAESKKISASKQPRKKNNFTPPTVEEVRAYIKETGSKVDAEDFINYNTSIGWIIGKNKIPMVSWKSSLDYWSKNNFKSNKETKQNQGNRDGTLKPVEL